ncbi:MAG: C40 family peptidase [Bacteroidota bacterium]|nr:C40 family peptidase [Bacteroidota bacterium]
MKYAGCCVPVSALRKEPSHKSEMVSQLLFGECCIILEYGMESWVKIKCKYDDYDGWCHASHVVEIDEENFLQANKELADDWVNEVDYNGHHMYVPYGSSLTSLNHGKAFWRKNSVQYSGKVWKPVIAKINSKTIKQVAYKFLNTTYLWGGKSVFGIDCSGFSQMVYKFFKKPLPRDAWQQAELGDTVNLLQDVVCGDLAFFDNEEGKITHVGIVLSPQEIIHASGKVRLDKLDKEGIVNLETRQRTHKLKVIKRYFEI